MAFESLQQNSSAFNQSNPQATSPGFLDRHPTIGAILEPWRHPIRSAVISNTMYGFGGRAVAKGMLEGRGVRWRGMFGWASFLRDASSGIGNVTGAAGAMSKGLEKLPPGVAPVVKNVLGGMERFIFGYRAGEANGLGAIRILQEADYAKAKAFSNAVSSVIRGATPTTITEKAPILGHRRRKKGNPHQQASRSTKITKFPEGVTEQIGSVHFGGRTTAVRATWGSKPGEAIYKIGGRSLEDVGASLGAETTGIELPTAMSNAIGNVRKLDRMAVAQLMREVKEYKGIYSGKAAEQISDKIMAKFGREKMFQAVARAGGTSAQRAIAAATHRAMILQGVGRVMSPLSIAATGFMVADILGDAAYTMGSTMLSVTTRLAQTMPALEFGGSFAGSQTSQARTERQDALSAISRARADSLRTIGNEASIMHQPY